MKLACPKCGANITYNVKRQAICSKWFGDKRTLIGICKIKYF